MSDGETPSPVEIREITDREFRIQRFLLRRAWGVLYAALSISMFMTVFGTPIAARLGLSRPPSCHSLERRSGRGTFCSGPRGRDSIPE
jgi:hypothetical protein